MKDLIVSIFVIPFIALLANIIVTEASIISLVFLFILGSLSIFSFWFFYAPYSRVIIDDTYIESPIFRKLTISLNDVFGLDLFEEYERHQNRQVLVRKTQFFLKNSSIELKGSEPFEMILMKLSETKVVCEDESNLLFRSHLLDSNEEFYESRTLRSIKISEK